MSLHYFVKLKMHCARATIELLKKETPVSIPLQLRPSNLPSLNPVDHSMWVTLQEKVYKTHITDLDLSMMPFTDGCCNDDAIQLNNNNNNYTSTAHIREYSKCTNACQRQTEMFSAPPIPFSVAVFSRVSSSRSVTLVLYTFSCSIPHTL